MVARKLAVRMFWMLKTKTRYPEVVRNAGQLESSLGENTEPVCERPASQAV